MILAIIQIKEIGRGIAKAAKARHASDYNEFYIASREEAENQIKTAKELIELVEKYPAQSASN